MTVNTESLRVLNVSGCKVITDEELKAIVARNKLLHTVDLSRCHHLTSASLQTVASNCKKLLRYDTWLSGSPLTYTLAENLVLYQLRV